MISKPHSFARLFGVLCVLWLLLHLPVLLVIRVLPWDAIDEFYPTVYFNVHTLRMGLAPWWNPFIYSGYPQIADPQGMLFSPLLMGWMLLRTAPGATWFDWGVLLHLLMGGGAMLVLLRRSGANAFGALVGATVFMAGGVAAARLEHVPDVLAYAWAPLVLLALRHFLAAPDWRRGLLFGLAAGALVTQLVQVTFLFTLMLLGYAIAATVMHWRGYSSEARWRWCVGVALAIAIALAAGLPQLLFTWAYSTLSNRATLPLSAAADASLAPRMLLSFFDPNVWHALRGSYTGSADRVEGYFYIGAIPSLLLVGLGTAWRFPPQRRQLIFFALVALGACLYMFGVNTPFYAWLYTWLPGVKQFRRPSDAAYLLNFSLAIFAGLGSSHFRLHSRRHVNVLLVITSLWLGLSSMHMRDDGVRWQVATILAALLALVALWRLQRAGPSWRTARWLLLILVADYRCFNLNGSFNQGHDNASRFRHDTTADYLAAQQHGPAENLPWRIETIDAGILWDNYPSLRQLRSTQGYNPLRYALYDHWYGARENGYQPRSITPYNGAPDSKLSDLLGVRYLIDGHPQSHRAGWPPVGYQRVFVGHTTDVWRNNEAYPYVLNPHRVVLLAPNQQPSAAAFDTTDFRQTLWLTPRDLVDQREDHAVVSTCTGTLKVSDIHAAPNSLNMHTQAEGPAWLVLGELDFPGWQADVDGQPLPILRANGMFRAVCMPAGNHTLRFVFHPWAMVAWAWQKTFQ